MGLRSTEQVLRSLKNITEQGIINEKHQIKTDKKMYIKKPQKVPDSMKKR